MPSYLTRNVFRRLLANEPVVYRGCLRRQARRPFSINARPSGTSARSGVSSTIQLEQRRNIFNFNIFRKRQDVTEADVDPGIEKMEELAKRERMRARLPPPEEVKDAIQRFCFAKLKPSNIKKRREPVTDTQAQLVLQSLQYLITNQRERNEREAQQELQHDSFGDDGKRTLLSHMLFERIAALLRLSGSKRPSEAHVELARLNYEQAKTFRTRNDGLSTLVYLLSQTGHAWKAREALIQFEGIFESGMLRSNHSQSTPMREAEYEELEDIEAEEDILEETETYSSATNVTADHIGLFGKAWSFVLKGFTQENNKEEVLQTYAMIMDRGIVRSRSVTTAMLDFSLQQGDATGVQEWWKTYRLLDLEATRQRPEIFASYTAKVLKWCIAKNELETGHEIVRDLMTSNPPKPLWDAILVWAAGTKKSVDEIDRMMTVMEKSNANIADQSLWRVPDIETINGLVEFAISRNDPYMAERFIALGRDRNIEPDARTLVLQMEYRLSVNDVDGALIAYKNLQSKDLSSNEDAPTVNRLVVALCKTNRHDFDTVMNVAADLSDRRVRFEPSTVSALSILHLNRDERDDVIDLLNTHAFHYSSTERQSIRDTILAFSLDPKTHTSRAWQGYTILKAIFDEMPRPERTELMTSFLDRERSDMGVHIFQNMRMHSRADTIPTVDTYVAAFMGLAKLRDIESLEVIHNLLKLDYNINTTTYLYNSLMIAYTACGKPRTSIDFWDDIVASREGPSYNSIHAALRACERAPWGDLRAQEIWRMLRKRNVELDQNLWASYIAALAGNGDTQLAIGTLEEAAERGEVQVDAFVLGNLFAGASGQVKQAEVELFGKEKFPESWSRLEELGVDVDENGMRAFKIDRKVGP